MASEAPFSSSSEGRTSVMRRPLGLVANAVKRKDSYIQLLLMAGIFMLSMRSLSQKNRIDDLSRDNALLREERDALAFRSAAVKEALFQEASLEPSGLLSDHIRRLFRDQ
ncbi:hypothetical protein Cni_G03358 [Canna indica]|uniref:Uncharacterized protein n=1 Tax=Canna indica TaxID=4628 RepID=A0AAQ3JR12_9LILI|nr:hypothetical protein Cni_G03358 [Canna indica]